LNNKETKTEEMWDIIARRELIIKEQKMMKECENDKSGQNPFEFDIDALERAAVKIYNEAVENLNTEKMWLIYIGFCFERSQSTLKSKYINKDVNYSMNTFDHKQIFKFFFFIEV
jgi:hypothetical protein